MGKKLVILIGCFVVAWLGVVQAAPVRVPLSVKAEDGFLADIADGKIKLGLGAEYEMVNEIESDLAGGELEFDTASAILSATYDERFSFYGTIGQIMDTTVKYKQGADSAVVNFDDEIIWGVGANIIFFEKETVKAFTDISYRETADLAFDSATLNGSPVVLNGESLEGKIEELQAALGATATFDSAELYGGVVYSDMDATASFTQTGTTYNGKAEKDKNLGLFVGVKGELFKGLEAGVQGRFLDETSVIFSLGSKF